MKRDLLHFVGSDAHNMKNRMPQMGRCAEYMEKHMGRDYTKQILIRNPKKCYGKQFGSGYSKKYNLFPFSSCHLKNKCYSRKERYSCVKTHHSIITFSVFKIIWKEDSADRFGGNYTESP